MKHTISLRPLVISTVLKSLVFRLVLSQRRLPCLIFCISPDVPVQDVKISCLPQLCTAHSQLTQYHRRYGKRLNAKNVLYVKQLLQILSCLIKHLGGNPMQDPNAQVGIHHNTTVAHLSRFLADAGIDHLNLFKILHFCEKSKIAQKVWNRSVDFFALSQVKVLCKIH